MTFYWTSYNVYILIFYPFLKALQLHRNFYLYILFCEILFYFLFKSNEDNSTNKNCHDVLMLFFLIMQTNLLLQDNAILLFIRLVTLDKPNQKQNHFLLLMFLNHPDILNEAT